MPSKTKKSVKTEGRKQNLVSVGMVHICGKEREVFVDIDSLELEQLGAGVLHNDLTDDF